ncbi:MAG TPA: ABC-F family ATP-binding cassette domain-containing protein [Bacteroidia bacterium]|jgi:ATP-binding cassette subfamily F protein uup|nr:ABC-F family ATP-binding cassette domain-containing protein [Bacteroidia bacterium]
MNYLSVETLSKAYGPKVLFDKINFGISQGQKVALVAKNGAGKTSLLNIIAGKDTPDSGQCTLRKEIRVAFLYQDPQFDPELTAVEVLFSGEDAAASAIRDYEKCLNEASSDMATMDRLHDAQMRMDELNAWDYEARAKQVLSKLGLEKHLEQKTGTLSGGQKKRLALAQILIQEPDLMILDEPTNHLDIEMTEWLEEYLAGKDITLLLVTHDRYFLDRICDEILELDGGNIYRYKGNYSYYVEKKAERDMNEASELDKAKNLYRRELEWVRKMPRARGTKAKARVDAFDDVKENASKKKVSEKVEMSVKMTRLGGKILEMIKLGKAWSEDKQILKDFSYVFKKGEKIGIVGKNGVGKTTFLNMILGLETPDTGKIQTGETIIFGYYSQAGMQFNGEKRVIEVIKDIAEYIPLADGSKLTASMLLQRFLFPPEVQYNFVSKLSGGEKRRLYLLTILITNPNFLILDEPTNDLDIMTLSTLEEFLADFPGCVLIVTHDRYFMDRLVDHLFIFEGEGKVRDFPGNYTQYRENLAERELNKVEEKTPAPAVAAKTEASNSPVPSSTEKRKITFKEKFEFEQLEKEIPQLEAQRKELEAKLSAGITDHAELQKISAEYQSLGSQLEEKGLRWMELSELV